MFHDWSRKSSLFLLRFTDHICRRHQTSEWFTFEFLPFRLLSFHTKHRWICLLLIWCFRRALSSNPCLHLKARFNSFSFLASQRELVRIGLLSLGRTEFNSDRFLWRLSTFGINWVTSYFRLLCTLSLNNFLWLRFCFRTLFRLWVFFLTHLHLTTSNLVSLAIYIDFLIWLNYANFSGRKLLNRLSGI